MTYYLASASLIALTLLAQTAVAAPAALLPRTGQTVCYTSSGGEIPCAGTRQDGDTRTGAAWPTPRFTDSNGTITDRLTDLVWLKNADCYGVVGWEQALGEARQLANGRCGLNDGSVAGQWRLPNRKEFLSLVNFQEPNGGTWLASVGFANPVNWWYWTSDSISRAPGPKWVFHPVGALWPDTNSQIVPRDFHAMFVRDGDVVPVTATVSGSNGSVAAPASVVVQRGTSATFTTVPAAGFDPVAGEGTTCPTGSFAGGTYTTGPVTAPCSVVFSFIPRTFTISTEVAPAGSGTVTCTPGTTIPASTPVSCTFAPSAGFTIATVVVDGVQQSLPAAGSYTHNFGPVSSSHSITASFSGEPLVDAMKAYGGVYGKTILTPEEKSRLDVAPLGSNGHPSPDGKVDVSDVVILLRRAVGIVRW